MLIVTGAGRAAAVRLGLISRLARTASMYRECVNYFDDNESRNGSKLQLRGVGGNS